MSLGNALRGGLTALGLDLSDAQQDRLLAFIALLTKWNRTYNLTAIRDEREMMTHHLLDSLSVLPALGKLCEAVSPGGTVLAGRRCADVGSGAGLPGIPLAIACQELVVTSIETVEKKATFQRQARIELGLANFSVENRRVEQVPAGGFDAVISRAFAELADFVRLAGHLLNPGGRLLAMKGVLPEEEIKRLPSGWVLRESLPLHVPGLDAQRHLLVIEKA
jgi:16S rRNA (guanine527-N7)-methyltransferase